MGLKDIGIIVKVKTKLTATFEIVDMGPISFYLSLKIKQDQENRTIKLFQLMYILKILAKYHLDKTNSTNTSIKETVLGLKPNLSTRAM